ncbi:ABC transporter substrate-binding protein [Dietzia sp. IN118]|uniref:ABC transporter substrate-binding protein n=1 Tax=Dietzia sp. IN118 TaxID=3061631 RepID=UPI00293970DB|nr:ABC transporter substrate-binding protein [Dietzia sp. IN118]MDV3354378.1 ABC transporter substrate-binding protein [Dietzia sp. IN118]
MRPFYAVTGVCLAVALAASGCAMPSAAGDGGEGGGSGGGSVGGRVVLADSAPLGEFNPVSGYGSTGVSPLYEGLLRPAAEDDETLPDLVPALAAADPEVSDDGLTWTVRLREGVRFHDGTALDSGDVAATYRAVADPVSGSPIASDYTSIARIGTPDPLTVEFGLDAPDPGMPARLLLGIAPSELLAPGPAAESPLNTAPVGTGPYRLQRLSPGEAVLVGDPDHRDGAPDVDTLVLRSVPDENARAQMIVTGEVDGTVLPPALAAGLAGRDGLELVSVGSADWRAVALPSAHPFTGDPAVRRALTLAVDRESLVEHVLAGHGRPATSPITDAYPEFEPVGVAGEQPDADPAARRADARGQLAEAGWRPGPDGVLVRGGSADRAEFVLAYPVADSLRRELASAVADQLREVGVAVELWGGTWDEIEARAGEVAVLLGGGDNPYTVDTQAYRTLHSPTPLSGPLDNPGGYGNADVDRALDAARRASDPAERTRLYRQAQQAYHRDPGHLFLVTLDHTYLVRDTGHTGPAPILEPHSHGATWGPWWAVAHWTARP